MTTNITPADVFTSPYAAPADGDPANGATFQAGHQAAANRTEWLKNRLAEGPAATVYRAYVPSSGGAVAINAQMPLLSAIADRPVGAWSLASNEIQVPHAGLYLVQVKFSVNINGGTSPTAGVFRLLVGAFTFGWATGERWSGAAGDAFGVSGLSTISITTPATQKLSLENRSAYTAQAASGGGNEQFLNPFMVTYLGRAT